MVVLFNKPTCLTPVLLGSFLFGVGYPAIDAFWSTLAPFEPGRSNFSNSLEAINGSVSSILILVSSRLFASSTLFYHDSF